MLSFPSKVKASSKERLGFRRILGLEEYKNNHGKERVREREREIVKSPELTWKLMNQMIQTLFQFPI